MMDARLNARLLKIAAVLLLAASARGYPQSEPPNLAPVPEPPEVPGRVQSGAALEPEVRITRGAHKTVTEYRINGALRAIKVEPDGGKPYYLVDVDGDGQLETRTNDLARGLLVPQWVLFSWQ